MTLTIKLELELEKALGARSLALGRPKSMLVREALRAYLADSTSPFELGRDLFARHAGPADLATNRKQHFAEALLEKRRGR